MENENLEIGTDLVTIKLKELGVTEEMIVKITEMGAESLDDLERLREEDLIDAGMPRLQARKLIDSLKPVPSVSCDPVATNTVSTVSFDILPSVPTDDSWLAALKAGGVLKVDQSTVISAIRAALAYRAGLYEVPAILSARMEEYADLSEEQVTPEFYTLRKEMTRRSYAEIFEAIPGLDGSFVTEGRKKQLFTRIDQSLWPAITNFNNQLKSWQEAWMQGAANPAIMMNAIMAASGGIGPMPPGMMQTPDTGVLRDSADSVADAINKVFAGTGVQIVAALAYDATRIREVLSNTRLPAMIGAANREQMLRQLGVAVPATYPRMEQNLTRFVLAVMQAKDQPSGNEELQYFGTLYMLGAQIMWDQLDQKGLTGIGGSPRRL